MFIIDLAACHSSRNGGTPAVDQGPRYAVYYVPAAQSDLYRFGSAVLGYDCYTGAALDGPDEFASNAKAWTELTEEPRRYGFHATLKAPFRLSPNCTETQLVSAVRSLAGLGHAIATITPAIDVLDDFAAIVPAEPQPALNALASSCTTILDAYRAPMSPQERARRIAADLNRSQIENLGRWGYPFVLSEFRFHMTLTGKIRPRRRKETLAVLKKSFDRMYGDGPIAVDRLALVKQSSSLSSFRVVSDVAMRSGA
jgi:putative phosphonate metabolism protein